MQYSLEMIFNVEIYIRNKLQKMFSRKFRVWFPSVSVPSKSRMSENSKRPFPAPTLTCGKVQYMYYILKCKAVKTALCLGLVFK